MSGRKPIALFFTALFGMTLPGTPSFSESRHERREDRLKESEEQNASAEEMQKAKPASISASYDAAWDIVVQVLKDKGLPIDKATKDVGQIKTEFQITNAKKPHQHGMRYVIDLRRISDAETEVKVCALEQIRTYRLQAEPWQEPLYNAESSDALTKAVTDAAAK
jgi:uncharacterized lipoprotein